MVDNCGQVYFWNEEIRLQGSGLESPISLELHVSA